LKLAEDANLPSTSDPPSVIHDGTPVITYRKKKVKKTSKVGEDDLSPEVCVMYVRLWTMDTKMKQISCNSWVHLDSSFPYSNIYGHSAEVNGWSRRFVCYCPSARDNFNPMLELSVKFLQITIVPIDDIWQLIQLIFQRHL
jgi:hypothetical protein